jgi:hypothetical protein
MASSALDWVTVFQPPVGVLLAGQVDVAVDQAGQHERVAQIDDPTLADEAVAHFDDLVPSDHESFIALHNAGGRDRPEAARFGRTSLPASGETARAAGRLRGDACGQNHGGERRHH